VDLHVHSTASDGTWTPAEIVRQAAAVGVTTLALADHDSAAGVPAALESAPPARVMVIPAVELTTGQPGIECHLLGYFVDLAAPEVQALLTERRAARRRRVAEMLARLQTLGCVLTLAEVEQVATAHWEGVARWESVGSDRSVRLMTSQGWEGVAPRWEGVALSTPEVALGRPHLAAALVTRGLVSTPEEAFRRYLDHGAPAYVPHEPFPPEEGIRRLREAGAVPVLAHPVLYGAERLLPRLVEHGLMGLEGYHPQHSLPVVDYFLRQARRYGLVVTGGSDAHGPDRPGLGSVAVPPEVVENLQQARERV
jgi:predicted metal-dependent phosphoesterase TrpH